MNQYIITTDTTCDMPYEYYKDNDVVVIPMEYILDGVAYEEFAPNAMPVKDFYECMRNGKMPKTSQISVYKATEVFESLLVQGKDILYLSFSSTLSGSYNSAVQAANGLKEKYPDRKILVFDSKAASMGEGLLLDYIIRNKAEGMSLEENYKWLEKNAYNLAHWFTVSDLFHLQRGGRVSKTAAVLGTMLNIKPVLHVDDEGRLIMVEKVRGRMTSIKKLVSHMEQTVVNPKNQIIHICHGDCLDEAQKLGKMVEEHFGVKKIVYNSIGPVIGAHSGPGTLAVFFMATKR